MASTTKKRTAKRRSPSDGLMLQVHPDPEDEQQEEEMSDQRIADFCKKYRINTFFQERMQKLREHKFVLIADDSGSMSSRSDANIEGIRTRWDELQLMTRLLIELYGAVGQGGLDVHFLNRKPVLGVKTSDDKRLVKTFKKQPAGPTPLCDALELVLQQHNDDGFPQIIVIATDGMPTDQGGSSDVARFRQMLAGRDADMNLVSIVACTDDDNVMAHLNHLDVVIRNLDVVDDYISELKEVQLAQGYGFSFTYADYVVKLTLGVLDPAIDRLDEITPERRAQLKREAIQNSQGCCTIM